MDDATQKPKHHSVLEGEATAANTHATVSTAVSLGEKDVGSPTVVSDEQKPVKSARQNANAPSSGIWTAFLRSRKAVYENLSLLAATLASIAAVYAGFVAEHARKDAQAAVNETLALQRTSTAAQIQSQELSVGPVLLIKPEGVPIVRVGKSGGIEVVANFTTRVAGQTPAIDAMTTYACGPSNRVHRQDLDTPPRGLANVFASDMVVPFSCSWNVYPDDDQERAVVLVEPDYRDLFGNVYTAEYCFSVEMDRRVKAAKWKYCYDFNPKVTITRHH